MVLTDEEKEAQKEISDPQTIREQNPAAVVMDEGGANQGTKATLDKIKEGGGPGTGESNKIDLENTGGMKAPMSGGGGAPSGGGGAPSGGGGGGVGGALSSAQGAVTKIQKIGDDIGSITTPEGLLMLIIAAIFDGIGLIPIVGDVSDIVAGIIFLIWMIAFGKKGWWKFAIAFILEAIPIVSDITPFISLLAMLFNVKMPTSWIGCVYSVLTGGSGTSKKVVPID